ncbi:hypothetical protein [Labedella endophytica]|uniref:hypothetical protein n=1 Tax=Labedella endophytica TaxID=1523160 RepID=UPI00140BABD6|nr:hypothetical protein [Labedella endophytica]
MSDETQDEAGEPRSTEENAEVEAHSRRRALVILVVVVVVALVGALVAWSIASNAQAPAATASASASASSGASDPDASDEPADPGAPDESADPADPEAGGEVTDDIREFDDTAPVGDGVTVALSDLEAVEGEASMPGEIAGPSLRFTVTFANDSDEAYSLLGAVTNVYFGADQTPAIELAEPGGVALPSEVAPGETVTGTFVYNVPTDDRGQVRITVDYAAAEPAVVFEGEAPR